MRRAIIQPFDISSLQTGPTEQKMGPLPIVLPISLLLLEDDAGNGRM